MTNMAVSICYRSNKFIIIYHASFNIMMILSLGTQ